jgi:hypothetical protein
VQLTKDYERYTYASDSILKPGETGVVNNIYDSSRPFDVRAPNGGVQCYRKEAIEEVVEVRAAAFGPTSKAGDTIGCEILFDASDEPATIFFTRNKSLVGRVSFPSHNSGMLFPVVSSASPAVVTVNLSSMSPVISMTCILNTFEFETKYNESSNKFKPVSIKGPKNSKGETPVIFNEYKDTVWVPHYRLRKTETPKQIKFSDLKQEFSSVVDGVSVVVVDVVSEATSRKNGPLEEIVKWFCVRAI